MNRILPLCLLVSIAFSVNAQSPVRLDSILFNNYIDPENPLRKLVNSYDDQDNIIKTERGDIVQNEPTISFNITAYDTFIYNEDGLVVEILYANTNTGVLSLQSRSKITYNVNSTEYITQRWDNSTGEWLNSFKSESVYDDDLLVESILYFWLGSWNIVSATTYTYFTGSNLLEEELSSSFDFNTSEEKLNSKVTYIYDENDFLDQRYKREYDEISDTFIPTGKTIYVNDEFGNRIENMAIVIDPDGLETVQSRRLQTFDTNVELTQINNGINISPGLPNKHIKLTFAQDHWENEEWVSIAYWEYFYSGTTNTTEISEFENLKIFPNPTSSSINLIGEALINENTSVHLINHQGSIIFSGRLSDPQINIEHLSSGVYHVLVRNNNSKFKGSFLKI